MFTLNISNTPNNLINIIMSYNKYKKKRVLLEEGRLFLKYILKSNPDFSLVRSYVKTIENNYNGEALQLPKLFIIFPSLLSLIRCKSFSANDDWVNFISRLNLATMLAETSTKFPKRFFPNSNIISISFNLIVAFVFSIFWFFLSIILKPIIRILLNKKEAKE